MDRRSFINRIVGIGCLLPLLTKEQKRKTVRGATFAYRHLAELPPTHFVDCYFRRCYYQFPKSGPSHSFVGCTFNDVMPGKDCILVT